MRETKDERYRLWREGKTDYEIAKAVGVNRGQITDWRRYNGLKVNPTECGIPMEDALLPEECNRMSTYLAMVNKTGTVATLRAIHEYNRGMARSLITEEHMKMVKHAMNEGKTLKQTARELNISRYVLMKKMKADRTANTDKLPNNKTAL